MMIKSNEINLYCAIVIYNAFINQSITFNNLIDAKLSNCHIMVADNSDKVGYKNSNEQVCRNLDAKYIDMGGDMGLSIAFNRAVNEVIKNEYKDNDIIIFLNDDTAITKEYLITLAQLADNNANIDIFAPIMQGQNGILYSPARQGFFKNHYPKTIEEEIPQKNFFAIASCCSCRLRGFDNYRFDEKIFMDAVDNDFCYEQRKMGRKFMKVNVVIQQNYELKNSNLSYERIQSRLKIMIPDLLTFCRKKKSRVVGFLPDIAARGVMYSYQCKNPKMWFWMMGYALKCMNIKATKTGDKL